MTAPERATRGPRRAPILAVVVVLLAAGVAAGHARAVHTPRVSPPVDATLRSSAAALSTAWYCPGLPSAFPSRDQTLTLSNVGAADADAIVTVQPDDGAVAPIVRKVTVPGESVRTLDRSSLAGAAGSLVVEPISPDVFVSAGIESGAVLESVPCANHASTDWYFAAGTTVRGVSDWLVLDDPFSADARVDISLLTDSGLQVLPSLQGIDVPGRSRVIVPLHDHAVRQARVAVGVHAAVGRVVAAQTLRFGAASGPTGVVTAIGALAPSSQWWFTDGYTFPGASQWVAVSALGPLDAQVFVRALTGSQGIVPAVVLTVPANGVSWVQVGGCGRTATGCLNVPAKTAYALEVHSDSHAPVVAQSLSRFGNPNTALGATTSMGSTLPAREWVIARTHAVGERIPAATTNPGTSIWLMNPGVRSARVSVEVVRDGIVDHPSALQDVTIAPTSRLAVPIGTAGFAAGDDAAVVITSDQPIFAESTIYGQRDATRSPGIPTR